VRLVDSKKPGDQVSIKLVRGSKTRTVEVKLAERPQGTGASAGTQQRDHEVLPPGLSP
jgi:S1-C subfamily serine protease